MTPTPQDPNQERKSLRLSIDLPTATVVALTGEAQAAGLGKAAVIRALVDMFLADPVIAADVIAAAKTANPAMRHRQHVSGVQRSHVVRLHADGHTIASIARMMVGLAPTTIARIIDEETREIDRLTAQDPVPGPSYDPGGPYGHRKTRRTAEPTPEAPGTGSAGATVHRLPERPTVVPQVATPDGLRDPQ